MSRLSSLTPGTPSTHSAVAWKSRRSNPLARHIAECARATPALWLAAGLLLGSELAMYFSPTPLARSGLEQWLLWLLGIGGSGVFPALSLVAMAVLWFWHRRCGEPHRVSPRVMLAVVLESLLLGLMLAMLIKATRLISLGTLVAVNSGETGWVQASLSLPFIPAAVSAGVHEEILFRLMALGGTLWFFRRWGADLRPAGLLVLVFTSALFAGLHYSILNPAGEPFEWNGLLCRFALGLGFGALFLRRGLAIAIGVHCAYNVFVML